MTIQDYLETGAIIAAVILYLFNEVRKEIRLKASRHKSLDHSVYIDANIYPILWEILSHYNAIRVYIVQFHNGNHFYTGQSIQRMTVSHEVDRKHVQKVKITHDNILINEMNHRVLMALQKNGMYSVTTEFVGIDSELYEWMKVYDIGFMMILRIIDGKTKDTVATLNIHWTSKPEDIDSHIYELRESSKRFEKIFDEL